MTQTTTQPSDRRPVTITQMDAQRAAYTTTPLPRPITLRRHVGGVYAGLPPLTAGSALILCDVTELRAALQAMGTDPSRRMAILDTGTTTTDVADRLIGSATVMTHGLFIRVTRDAAVPMLRGVLDGLARAATRPVERVHALQHTLATLQREQAAATPYAALLAAEGLDDTETFTARYDQIEAEYAAFQDGAECSCGECSRETVQTLWYAQLCKDRIPDDALRARITATADEARTRDQLYAASTDGLAERIHRTQRDLENAERALGMPLDAAEDALLAPWPTDLALQGPRRPQTPA